MEHNEAYRPDTIEKLTGRARYGADYRLPDMLVLKALFSPVPCGRVRVLDTAQALLSEGVAAVWTRADVAGTNRVSLLNGAYRPVMVGVGECVRHRADVLALVAADTDAHAAQAVEKIHVEIDPLPAAHTVEQAKAMGLAPACEDTICFGDVEAGFRQAAVIEETTFSIPLQEHAYLEPEGGTAWPDEFQTITVCCATQNMAAHEKTISEALGIPLSRLRLHAPYAGGAFGGKHNVSVDVFLALAVSRLHRPARFVWTREESLQYSCKKQASQGFVRMGLDRDGRIVAVEAEIEGPSAPYDGCNEDALGGVMGGILGPYKIENCRVHGALYPTTIPEIGMFRGVGLPDGVFLGETLLTRAGARLGLDQWEVRRRNYIKTNAQLQAVRGDIGMRNPSKNWIVEEVAAQALRAAEPLIKSDAPHIRVGRGLGVAKGGFAMGSCECYSQAGVQMELYLDGSVLVKVGLCELGQGLAGVVRRFTSHALGIPEDRIAVSVGDSHMAPKSGAEGFSQATVNVGGGIYDAADKLKAQLVSIARTCLNRPDAMIAFENGAFVGPDGETVLEWDAFKDECFRHSLPLAVTGREKPQFEAGTFGVTPVACLADVAVDIQTGQVTVLQLVHAHDTGKVICPKSARGQFLGAAVMAAGGALMEEYRVKNGCCETSTLAEYLIPTAMDVPKSNAVVLLETNPADALAEGAKGLAEHGMHCVAAAIANAIFDACGVRAAQLPITPERMLHELGKLPEERGNG